MDSRRPLVAEIKRNSLDDGPGIRSVVFFKGCPLACVWCHNPECIGAGPELIYRQAQCIGCRSCAKVCPEQAIPPEAGPELMDRERCTLCGLCADECPSGALSLVGKYYEPEDLAALLARDRAFYANSGGGVTLSGGEPTLALDYTARLAELLRADHIPVLLETCGDFEWDRFAARLLPSLTQIFVDLKFVDPEAHQRATGRDNRRILANLPRLLAAGLPVRIRIPLIPELTADPANLQAAAAWLHAHGVTRLALLPYNPLWLAKARGLGRQPAYTRDSFMTFAERDAIRQIFAGFDLDRDL